MSEGAVRQVRLAVLVLLPPEAVVEGDNVVLLPGGARYTVGPALYRLGPAEGSYTGPLGPLAAPRTAAQYVPYEDWPAGLEIDEAGYVQLSQPLQTLAAEGPEFGGGPAAA